MSSALQPLAPGDVTQAISLIQSAYASSDATQIQNTQAALLTMQRTRAAWGLIVPLLAHEDANVQFFGAHTAQAKISRGEMESQGLSDEEQGALKDTLLALVGVPRTRVVQRKLFGALNALAIRLVPGRPTRWEGWVEATVQTLVAAGAPSSQIHWFLAGAAEDVVAANLLPQPKIDLQESLRRAASLVLQSIAAVLTTAHAQTDPDALPAALACFVAWLPMKLVPDTDLASLLPPLISLLPSSPSPSPTPASAAASTALIELLARAPPSWSSATLLEPLILWARHAFPGYSHPHPQVGDVPNYSAEVPPRPARGTLRSHTRLLVALAEAGVEWVAAHLVDHSALSASPSSSSEISRAALAQHLLRLLLALTAIDAGGARLRAPDDPSPPADEDVEDGEEAHGDEESAAGLPLQFWFLLQEALWEVPAANAYLYPSTPASSVSDDPESVRGRGGVGGTPFTPASPFPAPSGMQRAGSGYAFPAADDDGDAGAEGVSEAERARTAHAQAAYVALVRVLRRKVVCGRGWGRDHLDYFKVYRREVGDTLVNAYYVLRADLLTFYVGDAVARIQGGRGEWEEIEATLYCLCTVHEAIDLDSLSTSRAGDGGEVLARVFAEDVWGRLPTASPPTSSSVPEMEKRERGERTAVGRLRRTALRLVDTYASYFTLRQPEELLPPLRYVIGALADGERSVCLAAALALRSLCDANRRALATGIGIGAFAEVHARLGGVPDSEKGKVLQSIASVIQALPPAEGIAPVEAMVHPILERVGEALNAVQTHPDAARAAAILQLEILAGIAKGLTRVNDPMAYDEEDEGGKEAAAVRAAREDPRLRELHGAVFDAIARVAGLWSADAEVGQALSELFKAITALPADVTLISLPAGPLLGVVVHAAARQLTAVWLALASILIAQLNPPPLLLSIKSEPTAEAEACVREALAGTVTVVLGVLGRPGGMVENPDIVQEFFVCMDRVAQDFTSAFCALPNGAFDALVQCAISALALQERYSLVAACTFLGTLVHRTALFAPLSPELLKQLQAHLIRTHGRALMRAVLCGFAGAAPRSATANLLELLGALVSRWDESVVGEVLLGPGMKAQGGGGGARAWVQEIVFAPDFFPSKAGPEAKERFVKAVVSSRSVKKTKEAANQFSMVAWGLEGSTFGYSSAPAV